jgi:cytochrome c-type protein NapB
MSDHAHDGARWQILLATTLALAFGGFLVGVSQDVEADLGDARPPANGGGAHDRGGSEGVAYAAIGGARRGPNAQWGPDFAALVPSAPGVPGVEGPYSTDAERAEALAARAARRAFDGAPPVIPHPIDELGFPNCLACHGAGAVVGRHGEQRVATQRSHEPYASCTQCHAPTERAGSAGAELAANGFVGRRSPVRGSRAWPGAPPTIPHSTWMRSECTSCHGPAGLSPLRSPHLDRRSCTQCHVSEAAIDLRPGLLAPPPLLP